MRDLGTKKPVSLATLYDLRDELEIKVERERTKYYEEKSETAHINWIILRDNLNRVYGQIERAEQSYTIGSYR